MMKRKRKGFTLVELLVVIVIITMLAALVAPRIFGKLGKAKHNLAKIGISQVEQALITFYTDCGRFPTQAEGLGALITEPSGLVGKWAGRYLKPKDLLDPWDNEFIYQTKDGGDGDEPYVIISLGADNAQGGEKENADISSEDL